MRLLILLMLIPVITGAGTWLLVEGPEAVRSLARARERVADDADVEGVWGQSSPRA